MKTPVTGLADLWSDFALTSASQTGHPLVSLTGHQSCRATGICERFHRTVLQEFYQVAFRKRIYTSIEQLQADLDAWIVGYNRASEHPSVYVIEEKMFC
jgi:hypothetical protein